MYKVQCYSEAHYAIQMRVAGKPIRKLCEMVGLDHSNLLLPDMEMLVCIHSVCKCGHKKLDEKTRCKLKKILSDRVENSNYISN